MSFIILFRQIRFRRFGVRAATDANFGRVDNLVDNVADQLVDDHVWWVAIYVGTGRGVRGGVLRNIETAVLCLGLLGLEMIIQFPRDRGLRWRR